MWEEQGASAPARFMLTFLYALLASHLWVQRGPLAEAGSGLLGWLHGCWQWLREGVQSGGSVVDDKVRRQMDEVRVRNCRRAMSQATVAYALISVVLCLWAEVAMDDLQPQHLSLMALLGLQYLACLVAMQAPGQVTSSRIRTGYAVVMLLITCRTAVFKNMTYFLFIASLRVMFRMVFGLLVLDFRISCRWNAMLSLACFVGYLRNRSVLPAEALPPWDVLSFFLMEAVTLLALQLVLFLVQQWVETRIRAMLDSHASDQAQQAVRQLLAVLCDAAVHLGPDLQIVGRAEQLANTLLVTPSRGGSRLEGVPFIRYLEESDQQRFLDFVAPSASEAPAQPGEAGCDGPPVSMHACMRDAGGLRFPVELFHVRFPDPGDRPGHLLGIREASNLPREARVDAPGIVGLVGLGVGRSDGAVAAAAVPVTEAPEAPAAMPGDSSRSSSGSSSSQRLSRGSSNPARAELEELSSVEVRFDALSPLYAVQRFTASFAGPAGGEVPAREPRPELAAFMTREALPLFRSWVEEQANSCFNGEEMPRPRIEGLQMLCPGNSTVLLDVASAELELAEDSGEDSEPEEEEGLPMLLRMTGFTAVLRARRSRRRHGDQSDRSSTRQILPAIAEAAS